MFSSNRNLAYLAAVVAVAATACSAPEARPAAVAMSSAVAPMACEGGSVQSAADAARFAGCEAVIGDLSITQSDLTDLSDFRDLRSVTGSVVIADNAKLISLAGLKGLESAHRVEIRNNPMLAAYYGVLPQLTQLDAPMVLQGNRGISKREVRQVLDRVQAQIETVGTSEASL